MDRPIAALWNVLWTSQAGFVGQTTVGLLAFALLEWGRRLDATGCGNRHGVLRDRLLIAATLIAVAAWTNFGTFHSANFIHTWDTYHYFIGAKYFPELRYDGLYECTILADAETGLASRIADEPVSDLRTNELVLTAEILDHPERCRSRFTAERWSSFRQDVGFFRDRVGLDRWARFRRDHGFNATPVWMLAGQTLTGLGAATLPFVTALCLVDLLLIATGFAVTARVFGWRTACVASIVFCTSFPANFTWTGGALLRYDWFLLTLLSVCAARAGRFGLSGAALGWAAALRLFPALIAVGPLLMLGRTRWVEGRWDPRAIRFLAAAIATGTVLSVLAIVHDGGLQSHRQFVANTRKHVATPLSNHMGLPTLMAYTPSGTATRAIEEGKLDPWSGWRAKRTENFARLRPLHGLAILAAAALIFVAWQRGGRQQLWVALGLSTLLIAVAVELTCYYYAFLGVTAVLFAAQPVVGSILVAQGVVSQLLGELRIPGSTATIDERYVALSALELATLAWVAIAIVRNAEPSRPAPPKSTSDVSPS